MDSATEQIETPRRPVRRVKSERLDRIIQEQQPARVTAGEAVRDFEPDHRWWHPFVAVMWLYTLGSVPFWTHVPAWVMAPAGVVCTVVLVMVVRRTFDPVEYGDTIHQQMTRFAWAAGLVASVWLVYAGATKPSHPPVLGMLVLYGLVFGGAYFALATRAPERKAERQEAQAEFVEAREEQRHQAEVAQVADVWTPMFEDAGLAGMRVVDKVETKAGFTLTVLDNPKKPVRFEGFRTTTGNLASIAAHEMERQGIELAEHQVRPEPTPAAHKFLLHISTKNPLRNALPYPMDRPVTTITRPIVPGLYEDGEDVQLTMLGVHGVMVGATGSGKTVFENNVLAAVTDCNDAALWIGGSDKLVPLMFPWLYPWLAGHTSRPAIDWVAGEKPREVLRMLAALYKVAKLRNKRLARQSKFKPSPADPAIVAVIEEASDLLIEHSKAKVKTFDGIEMTASQLVNAITRCARSAGVSLFMVTQYGLMDALGNHGSMAKRNITLRIAGRTYTDFDGTATLVGMDHVRTTKIRHHQFLVQPSVEDPRVVPAKAFELDGVDQIAPVAARNAQHAPVLPEWLRDELGDDYALRWDPNRLPDLVEAAQFEGLQWPAPPTAPTLPAATSTGTATQPAATLPVAPSSRADDMSDQEIEAEFAALVGSVGDVREDGQQKTSTPATDEEIERMIAEADAKMDAAIAEIAEYGPLGPTMSRIVDRLRAGNAPAWVPAWKLAVVAELVDENAPPAAWDEAGRQLVVELSGKPWHLAPEVVGGEQGWSREALLAAARKFLAATGTGAPAPRGTIPEPMASILAAVENLDDDDTIRSAELGRLIGRIDPESEDAKAQAIRFGRELGGPPWNLEAERKASGSLYRVGDLRAAAQRATQG